MANVLCQEEYLISCNKRKLVIGNKGNFCYAEKITESRAVRLMRGFLNRLFWDESFATDFSLLKVSHYLVMTDTFMVCSIFFANFTKFMLFLATLDMSGFSSDIIPILEYNNIICCLDINYYFFIFSNLSINVFTVIVFSNRRKNKTN